MKNADWIKQVARMRELENLAKLINEKNEIEDKISNIIDHPCLIGHVGEYVAAKIFGINLNESASHKGSDGNFKGGPLDGKSVNIKWYAKREGLLDIIPEGKNPPDYYLVMTGPKSVAEASKGKNRYRPWVITEVFLLNSRELQKELGKSGIATSVKSTYWDKAQIYPKQTNTILELNDSQKVMLRYFAIPI